MSECKNCGRKLPSPMEYCSTLCRDEFEGTNYSTIIIEEG